MKFREAQDSASPPSKRLKLEHSITSGTMMATGPVVVDLTESPPSSQFSSSHVPSNSVRAVKPQQPSINVGPKKLIIKNLRSTPRVDPSQYFDQVWTQLEVALSAIFRGVNVPYSLEDLYKGVENLCRQDRGPLLNKKLSEKCKMELTLLLKDPMTKEIKRIDDSGVLRAVVDAWSTWTERLVS